MPELPNKWKWAYDIFNPAYPTPGMIDTVAKRCVQDLNEVIGKRKRAFISSSRLGKDAAQRLAGGIREGAKIIEESFMRKFGNSKIPVPPGVLIRGQHAGWTWMGSGMVLNSRSRNVN